MRRRITGVILIFVIVLLSLHYAAAAQTQELPDVVANPHYYAASLKVILDRGETNTVKAVLADLDGDGADEMIVFEWNTPSNETNYPAQADIKSTVFDVENGINNSSSIGMRFELYDFCELYVSDKNYIILRFRFEDDSTRVYRFEDGVLSLEASIGDGYDVIEDKVYYYFNSSECSESYYNDKLSEYGVSNRSIPVKNFMYFDEQIPPERDDTAIILAMAAAQPASSTSDAADTSYIYEPSTSVGEGFIVDHNALHRINDSTSAKVEIFDTVSSLTTQQRQSGDVLDDVALYIENVLRLGASRAQSGEVSLDASTLAVLSAEASDIMSSAENSLRQTDVNLLRNLRTNLTIKSDETESLEIILPDNVGGINFDNVTVDAEFASVTLSKENIRTGGSIELKKVSLENRDEANASNANNNDDEASSVRGDRNTAGDNSGDTSGNLGNGADTNRRDGALSERNFLSFLLDFWCIGVIVLILIIWGVLTALKHRLRVWVVPAFTALALVINLGTYFLLPGDKKAADEGRTISARDDATSNAEGDDSSEDNSADDVVGGRGNEASDDGGNSGKNNATTGTTSTDNANGISSADLSGSIEVTMSAGIEATISMPAEGGDKDFLMLFNEEGEAQYSKYNYVTDTVDARVKESGIYSLKEYEVSFVDIEKKNDLMQEAILQLASKGLMSGTTDGFFYPDKMITRAELVSAIVRAFDLLDTGAQSRFSDLDRSDWYYSAAASAEKEQIINGFEDNTFRGEQDIPKDQLVAVSANTLIAQMGYLIPADIEAELERYLDRSTIPGWAEESIALATQSNIMIYRTDSLFAPKSIMTRGDAAIILYRVFSKAW